MKELSLRPYNGNLFLASDLEDYQRLHSEVFNEPDVINCSTAGRFTGGEGKDGLWTYLVWADTPHLLAHELSHVVLHVFERCGIDPREANGEPFCYMLSQLMIESINYLEEDNVMISAIQGMQEIKLPANPGVGDKVKVVGPSVVSRTEGSADPHAELKAIYQPGMRWRTQGAKEGPGEWGPWHSANQPGWLSGLIYEIHPDDLPKQAKCVFVHAGGTHPDAMKNTRHTGGGSGSGGSGLMRLYQQQPDGTMAEVFEHQCKEPIIQPSDQGVKVTSGFDGLGGKGEVKILKITPISDTTDDGWITVPDDCMEMPEGLSGDTRISVRLLDGYCKAFFARHINWRMNPTSPDRVTKYRIIKPAK